MSCRVAFRSTNFLKVSLVTTAAILAACLLALVGTTKPAGATFPGVNGKIAFSRDRGRQGDGDAEIYTIKADGSHLMRLTNNSVDDTQPDWSPDGTKIAFVSGVNKGNNLEIYTMNADGTEQTRLTNDPHGDRVPVWSPDGTKIAFASVRGNAFEVEEIYVMNADGTEPTNISNLTVGVGLPIELDSEPSWSPDGTQIAYRCYVLNGEDVGQSHEVCVMNAYDGSARTRLTFNPVGTYATYSNPDWSPDGTKIAYDKNDDIFSHIEVMNADGTNQTALTTMYSRSPSWSPDGTKIVFAREKEGDFDIYTIDADGTDVAQITANPEVKDMDPDWQPLLPKSPSVTVHPPDTGGPSLLLVASALLCSVGSLLYAGVRRRM